MSIASTILEQLGGNKFIAMTGCNHFVSDGNTLRMQIPRNAGKANRLWITLDGDDTYTMRFFYYRQGGIRVDNNKMEVKEIPTIEKDIYVISGIYFDQLQEIFTEQTGMYTHL